MERIFGVLKKRFKCIRSIPEYSLHNQALIVYAITAIHNVIREYKDADEESDMWEVTDTQDQPDVQGGTGTNDEDATGLDKQYYTASQAMNNKRDKMAEEMWAQYQEYMEMNNTVQDSNM